MRDIVDDWQLERRKHERRRARKRGAVYVGAGLVALSMLVYPPWFSYALEDHDGQRYRHIEDHFYAWLWSPPEPLTRESIPADAFERVRVLFDEHGLDFDEACMWLDKPRCVRLDTGRLVLQGIALAFLTWWVAILIAHPVSYWRDRWRRAWS